MTARRIAATVLAVSLIAAVVMVPSPVDAATKMSCASFSGTLTYSPPLPMTGDPATVTPTITATQTFNGCAGLGVTGGTGTFTGAPSAPQNCDSRYGPTGNGADLPGTAIVTWNTGQTSTLTGIFPISYTVTAGLFQGAVVRGGPSYHFPSSPLCFGSPLSSGPVTSLHPTTVTLPSGVVACASPQSCTTSRAASATAKAPGLEVTARGTPATGTGTISLKIKSGTLKCPKLPVTVAPIADLTPTGFVPTDRITVTAKLPSTSSTSPEQVCFDSTLAFRSQSSPKVPKPGPALLLNCNQVANAAPCVVSRKVGTDVVVTFVIGGVDPRFYIVLPKGRRVWLSQRGTGKVGRPYRTQLQTSGGIFPVTWSVASGKLPQGCVLDARTGSVHGTPTKKGSYSAVIKATDSEKPPKSATMSLPIKVS